MEQYTPLCNLCQEICGKLLEVLELLVFNNCDKRRDQFLLSDLHVCYLLIAMVHYLLDLK